MGLRDLVKKTVTTLVGAEVQEVDCRVQSCDGVRLQFVMGWEG